MTRANLPGTAYIRNVSELFDIYYRKGELFMEFVKDRCKTTTGQQCKWCATIGWKCTPFQGIPAPYPAKTSSKQILKF